VDESREEVEAQVVCAAGVPLAFSVPTVLHPFTPWPPPLCLLASLSSFCQSFCPYPLSLFLSLFLSCRFRFLCQFLLFSSLPKPAHPCHCESLSEVGSESCFLSPCLLFSSSSLDPPTLAIANHFQKRGRREEEGEGGEFRRGKETDRQTNGQTYTDAEKRRRRHRHRHTPQIFASSPGLGPGGQLPRHSPWRRGARRFCGPSRC
jgi:hypothetical protein